MISPRTPLRALAATLVIALSASGCYGGPCADPTMMVLINFVVPALLIGAVIYVRVTRD